MSFAQRQRDRRPQMETTKAVTAIVATLSFAFIAAVIFGII